jgi:phenylpyruvate tautomerase PptA (4-oxalocrotonate tautomerase family)
MPLITLKSSHLSSDAVKNRLAESLTELTEQILRKNKALTVLRLDEIGSSSQYYIGGRIQNPNQPIFDLTITITQGTNTAAEKAQWIAGAWQLMGTVLGESAYPNYITVQEIDGHSWGYNGLTQASAQRHSNPQASANGNHASMSHPMTSDGQLKLAPEQYNSIYDRVFQMTGMEAVSLPAELEFVPYQPEVREGVSIHTLFSLANQTSQGPDAAILKYEPGAFVALHEHMGHEMVVVLSGDYIENGVTFKPGSLVLRSPGTFHTMASSTGCTILATRYIPVKQRPDIFNEFAARYATAEAFKSQSGQSAAAVPVA